VNRYIANFSDALQQIAFNELRLSRCDVHFEAVFKIVGDVCASDAANKHKRKQHNNKGIPTGDVHVEAIFVTVEVPHV
jgi:hypothetical protein